jgi:hypothetical protein
LLLGWLAVGCAGAERAVIKSASSLAVTARAAYLALDAADEKHQGAIRAQAIAGDTAGARIALATWLPNYKRARMAIDSAYVAIAGALEVSQVIGAARDKRAAAQWVAQLAKIGGALAAAMAELGGGP